MLSLQWKQIMLNNILPLTLTLVLYRRTSDGQNMSTKWEVRGSLSKSCIPNYTQAGIESADQN